MSINLPDYIATDFGHVSLNLSNGMKCNRCGMVMSTSRAMSLRSHIMQVIGFVEMHKDCVDGEPHPIFGKDYGVVPEVKKSKTICHK